MTIDETKQLKRELEAAITRLLLEFSTKSRLRIEAIDLDKIENLAEEVVAYHVTVEVRL